MSKMRTEHYGLKCRVVTSGSRVRDGENTKSKLADGTAREELGRENALAEGHLRMMETLEKHFHTGLADFFLMNTDG